jgi:hypothetical protein
VIRSRLHELFLDLVLDRDTQVAYTRQRQGEAGSFPVLLRKAPLNFLESALVIYLRQQLLQGAAADERVVVSQQELHDHLAVFERTGNQDRSGFEGKTCAAVDKLHKLGLLRRLGRGGERFEVSPTLKLLFSARTSSGSRARCAPWWSSRHRPTTRRRWRRATICCPTARSRTRRPRHDHAHRPARDPGPSRQPVPAGRDPVLQLGHLLRVFLVRRLAHGPPLRRALGVGQVDDPGRPQLAADAAQVARLQRGRARDGQGRP